MTVPMVPWRNLNRSQVRLSLMRDSASLIYSRFAMARLAGPPDRALELQLLSYEFAHADDRWDANWLIVRIAAVDGPKQWSAAAPAFLTWELADLIAWLRKVADVCGDVRDGFDAIEPNLRFEAEGQGGSIQVRASLSHEFHPGWTAWRDSGSRYDLEDVVLAFELGATELRQFADELAQELTRFPERSVDR
jgi:hypothetical protein